MRFLTASLASAFAAYGLSLWLSIGLSPEVSFWRNVMTQRDQEIAEVRQQSPESPIIFFTGGSSTAFSVDPAIIEKVCGLPTFNLGLPISTGAPYIVHQALSRCQPGDILIVCLEADALISNSEMQSSTLAFALAAQEGNLQGASGGASLGRSLTIPEWLSLPRPGARFIATLAARGITRKGYRYTIDDYRYRGRIETQVSDASMSPLDKPVERKIGENAAILLRQLATAADTKGVKLYYSMPWRYTLAETSELWQEANRRFLDSIEPIIPVIDDGTLGVASERSYFSDSHQHLTAAGSKERTSALASALSVALGNVKAPASK